MNNMFMTLNISVQDVLHNRQCHNTSGLCGLPHPSSPCGSKIWTVKLSCWTIHLRSSLRSPICHQVSPTICADKQIVHFSSDASTFFGCLSVGRTICLPVCRSVGRSVCLSVFYPMSYGFSFGSLATIRNKLANQSTTKVWIPVRRTMMHHVIHPSVEPFISFVLLLVNFTQASLGTKPD